MRVTRLYEFFFFSTRNGMRKNSGVLTEASCRTPGLTGRKARGGEGSAPPDFVKA